MKKQYMMPETDVVLIESAALLVESFGVNNGDDDDVIESSGSILSRGGSSWGDED